MKLKDKKILIGKSTTELKKDLAQAILDQNKLRLDLKVNKLKDTSKLKKARYKIALIKTLISKAKP